MEKMKTIQLNEIFDDDEIQIMINHINSNELTQLRKFLNSKKTKLEKVGILPDYLYYYLQYALK